MVIIIILLLVIIITVIIIIILVLLVVVVVTDYGTAIIIQCAGTNMAHLEMAVIQNVHPSNHWILPI